MKKIMLLLISFVIGLLVFQKNDEIIIPSDAIRIRIIANSNSTKDLLKKKMVKEEIKNELYGLFNNVHSNFEADNIILNNMAYINKIVAKKVEKYEIKYGLNYFPKKIYKGVIYPEGEYQSLVITLGNGLGDNWWCVLYPPLCLIDDNSNYDNVSYRLLVSDLLNN